MPGWKHWWILKSYPCDGGTYVAMNGSEKFLPQHGVKSDLNFRARSQWCQPAITGENAFGKLVELLEACGIDPTIITDELAKLRKH